MEEYNIETMLLKLQEIRTKGESVEMKNKERFKNCLSNIINILKDHKDFFNSQKKDYSCCKSMNELNDTIIDLEDKLSKLGLIKYCRDRAEKIFAQVTEKLYNNYLLLISIVSKKVSSPPPDKSSEKKEFLDHLSKLSQRIVALEQELKKKDEKPVEIQKETFNEGEKHCFEGLKYYLGLAGRVNLNKAFDLFKQSQSKNCPYSMIMLARMYEKGEFVDKSLHNSYELYRDASEINNSTGLHMIGHYAENKLVEDVKEFEDTNEMAMSFYYKSAEKENSDSYFKLGMIFEQGLLSQKVDNDKAINYYKKAIELDDNPEALNCLGSMYYNGKHLKQNYSIGSEYFLKAAKNGNSDAMNNIGLCYEYGKGTIKNHDKALNYYQMASDRLNPRALSNKAILLLKNNVTMNKKDFKETIRLLKLSIHLDPNNKDANYHLGNIYENGLGIPQNVYMALKFYKKGMKLGHLKSQTKFAVALYNGYPGVIQKDEKTALELLEDSANKEEPDALNYLGLLLEKGSKSVRQDKEKSVQFFKKSHEKGNDLASLNLALNLKSTPMISAESSNNYKEFIHISAKRGNEFAKMLDEHILANEKAFKNTKVGMK